MSKNTGYWYKFRKYPIVRLGTYAFFCLVVLVSIFLISKNFREVPSISSVVPPISVGGEVITIKGKNFGNEMSDSYVELAGNRITASDYTVWTDSEITLVLPYSATDGLLYVVTSSGSSEPVVFSTKDTIPIPLPQSETSSKPKLSTVSTASGKVATVGSVITLTGVNFGSLRNDSAVFFSAKIENLGFDQYIECSNFDNDYLFWGNQEISVRVPDGATTGFVFVRTPNGESNRMLIDIDTSDGSKKFSDQHTYILSVETDISNISAKENASILLFTPCPPQSAMQRSVEISETVPKAMISNYENTIVQQLSLNSKQENLQSQKFNFKNSFAVTVCAVETTVNNPNKKASTLIERNEFTGNFTKPSALIPSDNEKIIETATKIVKKEKSTYNKAKMIYDYLIDNFVLLQEFKPLTSNTLDVFETGSIDSYDSALLFTSLCRAADIPTIMNAGILVGKDLTSKNHWWAEFYLDDIGWIPVDPAMGAGLEHDIFKPKDNPREFYFGNIDSQHIAFSRDFSNVKTSQQTGKRVLRPRTFALQSVWEESSDETLQYSSFWTPVRVQGVF